MLYVFGLPILILTVLWKNRKHLHNLDSPKHETIKYELGGLYVQYEEAYFFFEVIVILYKMLMTGS